jgi:hypothetical protein
MIIELEEQDEADKAFNKVVEDCISIRKERKLKYGNCWFQEEGVEANFWGGIVNKFNRVKILHKNRNTNKAYETYKDCLRDLVILTIFTLACLEKEEKDL